MGWIERVIPKRDFDYSDLQAGASREDVLAEAIDVTDALNHYLLARVWSATVGSGASLKIVVRNTLPSNEDPDLSFDEAGSDMENAVTTVTERTLIFDRLSQGWGSTPGKGPYFKVVLRATQASTPTTIQATLGVDLSLREN